MTSLITGTPLLLAGSSAASQPPISIAPGGGGSPFGFLPEHPLCSAGPRPHLCRGRPAVPGPPACSASGPREGSEYAVAVGFE